MEYIFDLEWNYPKNTLFNTNEYNNYKYLVTESKLCKDLFMYPIILDELCFYDTLREMNEQ